MTYTFKKDQDRAKISIQKKSECIILCVSRGITIEETSYIRLETLELMRKYFHFFFHMHASSEDESRINTLKV